MYVYVYIYIYILQLKSINMNLIILRYTYCYDEVIVPWIEGAFLETLGEGNSWAGDPRLPDPGKSHCNLGNLDKNLVHFL